VPEVRSLNERRILEAAVSGNTDITVFGERSDHRVQKHSGQRHASQIESLEATAEKFDSLYRLKVREAPAKFFDHNAGAAVGLALRPLKGKRDRIGGCLAFGHRVGIDACGGAPLVCTASPTLDVQADAARARGEPREIAVGIHAHPAPIPLRPLFPAIWNFLD
jgi:hypothetical protein